MEKKLEKIRHQKELLNLPNHKILHDNIVVVGAEIEDGGISSVHRQYEDMAEVGLVVGVGDDVVNVEVGDVIFMGKYSTTKVTAGDVDYLILRWEDVICVANQ